MAMLGKNVILASAALVAAAACISCTRKVVTVTDSIPFVQSLITDSIPLLNRISSVSGKVHGPIVVVGEPQECSEVARQFIECDSFDNIDARTEPDGLPDFAGERIVALMDFAGSPYSSCMQGSDGTMALRELAVRNALHALDTLMACKMLVITSPLMAEHGASDVCRFLSAAGLDVPVVCSTDSTFSFPESAFRVLRKRNAFTHVISYPQLESFMTVLPAEGCSDVRIVGCEGLYVSSTMPEDSSCVTVKP